ncbi:IclR family transcriptional regulator [Bordetella ansorpii]|uniref:IclR family transcriptional regulator n=1 Tax=Bordetella ansorpii TaxID=288768 RepID=A0A157KKZ7_9BORD|nr:IclR family transcriptional regulator [Bordetella ansorpii]SAH85197.1 IclR family transcriptional regulator [Bordetella ansorpii]
MQDTQFGAESAEGEVSALARGLAVLRFIGGQETAPTLKDISEGTGIPKATTLRLVGTLTAAGLLRRPPGSERYALGPGVMALSHAYLSRIDLRAEARGPMRAFAEEAGVTVHLGTRDRLEMVLLESVRPASAAIVMRIGIGARLGLATSASGRAYLAGLPEEDRHRLIDSLRVGLDDRWPMLAEPLQQALAQYQEEGYVASFGEWHPDVNAVATPLVMPDGEIYSLNCGGPAFKLPPEVLCHSVAPRLLECARSIMDIVGGMPASTA